MASTRLILKAKIGVVVLMSAGAAFAAPYEVTGPDAPKPHEQTAIQELSAYLGKRVAGKVRIGGRDGVVFRVGDTAGEVVVEGRRYWPRLTVETYDATTAGWVRETRSRTNSYTIDKSALGDRRIRLSWTWEVCKGMMVIVR